PLGGEARRGAGLSAGLPAGARSGARAGSDAMTGTLPRSLGALGLAASALLLGCERPPPDTVHRGYRGLGMAQVNNARPADLKRERNATPEPIPAEAPIGQPSSAAYQNIQVLKDTDAGELMRLMQAITEWVAPDVGCTYCHGEGDLASDALYTKIVS